jgi:rubredoxin
MAAEKTADVDDRDESQEEGTEAKAETDPDEGRLGEEIDGEERWKEDETVSEQATCPECGEPVHNLRMTCPMCGHEYKDKEYDDDDAGTEFRAGAEIEESEVGEAVKEGRGKEKTKASASDEDDDEDEKDD